MKLLLALLGFRKALSHYLYSSHKSYKEYLEFVFCDNNGRKYYRFNHLKNMPLAMLEQLTMLQLEMESRIKGPDLDKWIEQCKKLVSSGSKTAIADMGHMLGALEERRTLLLDPVLMMEIASLLYIREDEDPTVYNKDLHREKYRQFNSEKAGGLYDFFLSAGLSRYMPSVSFTPIEWNQFLRNQEARIKRFNGLLGKIGSLKSELLNTPME